MLAAWVVIGARTAGHVKAVLSRAQVTVQVHWPMFATLGLAGGGGGLGGADMLGQAASLQDIGHANHSLQVGHLVISFGELSCHRCGCKA